MIPEDDGDEEEYQQQEEVNDHQLHNNQNENDDLPDPQLDNPMADQAPLPVQHQPQQQFAQEQQELSLMLKPSSVVLFLIRVPNTSKPRDIFFKYFS